MKHLSGVQRGVTLVELLVAMTIGLMIALVITQAYLNGVRTQQTQNDMTRLQESARFAFQLVSDEIKKAGFRDTYKVSSTAHNFCSGTTTPGSQITGQNDLTTVSLLAGGTSAVLNNSDAITVRYYGENNAAGNPDGAILDCTGNPVGLNTLVTETLYISADPANSNEPTLYCDSSAAAAPVGLIAGVESMQFLYGEDSDGDGIINYYAPFGSVALPTQIDQIKSVMVSLVIRTPNAVGSGSNATVFNHFGSTYAAGATAPAGDAGSVFTPPLDNRIRLQSGTVVALRNSANCS